MRLVLLIALGLMVGVPAKAAGCGYGPIPIERTPIYSEERSEVLLLEPTPQLLQDGALSHKLGVNRESQRLIWLGRIQQQKYAEHAPLVILMPIDY